MGRREEPRALYSFGIMVGGKEGGGDTLQQEREIIAKDNE